ncbi:MAG: CRTAC1 family protein [Candidatus Latescibacterota bacterium]
MMKKTLVLTGAMLLLAVTLSAQNPPINQFLNGSIFRDVSEQSGFIHQGHGKCTAMADFNNDGRLDIYISVVYGKNKLFQNEGNLKFREVTESYGLDCKYDTHGIAVADFNNDGYLDLFLANNLEALTELRGVDIRQPNFFYIGNDEGYIECAEAARVAGGPFNYAGGVATADINGDGLLDIYTAEGGYRSGPTCANSLFVNNGDGTYRDIGAAAGVADEGNGYCCSFADYDNDGDPDLFVGNLNDKDTPTTRRLYRNDGNLKFTDVTKLIGEARGYTVTCLWLDIENDGDQDLFLANSNGFGAAADPKYGANSLFRNNGDGSFSDVSKESGVDMVTNSRGATFGDMDNDGDLDIYVTNSRFDSLVFLNDGKGKFTESHQKTGGAVYYGHGCALGDLDGDGDLDLTAGNWRRPGAQNPGYWKLFQNQTNNRNFIKLDLQGAASNRSAVMSKVTLYDAGRAKTKSAIRGHREVWAGSGTFPGNPLQVHFGADAAKKYDIVVTFPSGKETVLRDIAPGQTLQVVEPK